MDTRLVNHALRDARYGLRLLKRSPIFTVVAILSLALGIGANAAIFHLIDTIQLRSLAIAHPQELAEVRPDGPQAFGTYDGVNAKATGPLWELIRANQSAFSTLFAWGDAQFVAGRGAESPRFGHRVVGQRRLLRHPRHRSREWTPARAWRRSQWMRRGGRDQPRVLAVVVRRQRERDRECAHRARSAGHRHRRSAGVVHGPRGRRDVRHRVAALRHRALGRAHAATRSLVADDHGPAEAGVDRHARERAPARVEPRRSRRNHSAGLRPLHASSPVTAACGSALFPRGAASAGCATRTQPR